MPFSSISGRFETDWRLWSLLVALSSNLAFFFFFFRSGSTWNSTEVPDDDTGTGGACRCRVAADSKFRTPFWPTLCWEPDSDSTQNCWIRSNCLAHAVLMAAVNISTASSSSLTRLVGGVIEICPQHWAKMLPHNPGGGGGLRICPAARVRFLAGQQHRRKTWRRRMKTTNGKKKGGDNNVTKSWNSRE